MYYIYMVNWKSQKCTACIIIIIFTVNACNFTVLIPCMLLPKQPTFIRYVVWILCSLVHFYCILVVVQVMQFTICNSKNIKSGYYTLTIKYAGTKLQYYTLSLYCSQWMSGSAGSFSCRLKLYRFQMHSLYSNSDVALVAMCMQVLFELWHDKESYCYFCKHNISPLKSKNIH